jgi:hypothetical protein
MPVPDRTQNARRRRRLVVISLSFPTSGWGRDAIEVGRRGGDRPAEARELDGARALGSLISAGFCCKPSDPEQI